MKKSTLIILLIICSVFILPRYKIFAVNADDVRQQIQDTNSQIAELDKQIQKYQEQINTTGQEKNSLSKLIKELTLTRNKLVKEKEQIQKKITATNLRIKGITLDIGEQERSIKLSKQSLSQMIVDLYVYDNYSMMERLLSQESLTEASKEYNNFLSINKKIQEHLTEVKNQKQVLIVSKVEKESEQEQLTSLKKDLSLKQQVVEVTKKEKDKVLNETKNLESAYKKLLAEQIIKRDAFEKELSDYEDQLKFILNPSLIPIRGSEVFSWPLQSVLITQMFGVTSDSGRLYRSGSHSGVDMRAAIGTSVMAMASGTVKGSGDTDIYCKGASFGKWILIEYNNGLSSVFGHLSVISAKTGEKVKAGDVVALSGNTGHTTGPHLHTSVYASEGVSIEKVPSLSCNGKTFIMPIASKNAYLDLLDYSPFVTPSMIK